ncbi:MAG: PQQ-dependent sugar dehydrogenase, partial [Bacteroidales bacterium]|nr:PQQ-dependent sugar dehydrogenase [Bacteroidales bacterium]
MPFLLLLAFTLTVSCQEQANNNDDKEPPIETPTTETPTEPTDPTSVLPPVETEAPNVDYKPAFKGQTRINGVKTETPYEVQVIAQGLSNPWSVASLPDGRLVITEKKGTLRIVTTAGDVGDAITGFPDVDNRSQGGLLDVVAAPDFNTSRMLYFTLAEFAKNRSEGSLTAVGKGKLSSDESKIENFEIIFRAIPYYDNSMHFGSRIVFDNKGNIFVSTGERSVMDTRPKAQTLDNGYGKVVYITTEGKPVAGNPFMNTAGALPEIYSYGHRNAQGLDIHPVTGELWLSEMGPRGGDEINLIKPGKNYGWPTIGYGIEYDGKKVGKGLTQQEGMEQPVYYWDPVLSPSGMTFYNSDVIAEWK